MARKENAPGPWVPSTTPPRASTDLVDPKRHRAHQRSPPRTPSPTVRGAARAKGKGRAARDRPALRETFDAPSAASHGANRKRSDSHDLSWSPRQTRDSVVDNMLLSFDQLFVSGGPVDAGSKAAYTPFSSDHRYNSIAHFASTRSRGHTFSSSLSSDYSTAQHDTGAGALEFPAPRHRSNSSSNFQSALGRIDSVRALEEKNPAYTQKTMAEVPPPVGLSGRTTAIPSNARKGSKSSGSSSLDFGHVMGSPKWQRPVDRRSSSFDQGYNSRPSAFPHDTSTGFRNPPPTSRSYTTTYDHDDAAPTPTVPAGPRGPYSPLPTATFPPPPAPRNAAQPLPLRRKDSKRSPAALFSRHEADDSSKPIAIRDGKEHRPHTRSTSRDLLASTGSTAAPGASALPLGVTSSVTSGGTHLSSGKERPGFFRRVFGSSKNITPQAEGMLSVQPVPLSSYNTTYNNSRVGSRSGQAPGAMTSSRALRSAPATISAKGITKDEPPVTLNKKPSFFRRRKKSLSGDIPLPIPPSLLHPQMQSSPPVQAVESSPVSSLRKVMNPYLSSTGVPRAPHDRPENMQHTDDMSKFPDFLTPELPLPDASVVVMDDNLKKSSQHAGDGTLPGKQDARTSIEPTQPREQSTHESGLAQTSNHAEDKTGHAKPKEDVRTVEVGTTFLDSPTDSNFAPDVTPSTETESAAFQKSHTRSGSDKVLPKLPGGVDSVSSRDLNPPKHKFPAIITKRTTSKDWNGASILLTPTNEESLTLLPPGNRSPRVWIRPTASEEELNKPPNLVLALESRESIPVSAVSVDSDYKSAVSKLATPTVEITPQPREFPSRTKPGHEATEAEAIAPTEEDRELAKKFFDGDDDVVEIAGAAAWLGGVGADRERVRTAYMELFDWQNLNILAALRSLCSRLLLKAESQEVDRILSALSARWCACNPNHGFKATDVVHTILYSIILLNTDLYNTDIERKMTRSEFVKNIMPTIRSVATDAAPHAFEPTRAPTRPPPSEFAADPGLLNPKQSSLTLEARSTDPTKVDMLMGATPRRASEQLASAPSYKSEHEAVPSTPLTPLNFDTSTNDCGPLVKAPFQGKLSTWEAQVEIVLKDFYNSIRQQRLPLFGGEDAERAHDGPPTSSSLSAFAGNVLRRTPSMLSKAGSESQATRGRLLESRIATGRWTSKARSRPRLYPSSIVPSSRTSFDDGDSSALSPSASSVWSKYSYGKTQNSMSVTSFASSFPQGDYQQSIGFANALSQAIIREETSGGPTLEEGLREATFLEDESLELSGAPWAKEGILKHKHHLESVDKKAKDRHWNECFAVIEKGWVRLFQFNMNAKSMRLKAKNQKIAGGVVGGGNWMENAEPLGKFLLRQTIASALPPPGYSKLRPHVWALSLPTGAVHLFQVGTPEIVKEFVTTANYWSARLSKEPLVGGISNVEYGWSEGVINLALVQAAGAADSRPPSTLGMSRPSLQSSIRSSLDHQGSAKPKLPGDRVVIGDWTPPQQSMVASALMEVDQLKALSVYVQNIEDDLQKHNQFRGAMLLAFSSRHPNHSKAMANWERKSSYLLREIVKFRTYIDCLQAARARREEVYAARTGTVGDGGGDRDGNGDRDGIRDGKGREKVEVEVAAAAATVA